MRLMFQTSQPEMGDVHSYFFVPEQPQQWQAGQSIKIELPGTYEPQERRFTIASAPHEGHIRITTRQTGSSFKNQLAALQPGDVVSAFNIDGDFVWRDHPQPSVFIAMGIGITPYRSMLLARHHAGLPLHAQLMYAARDGFVFKDELDALPAELTTHYVPRRLTAADIPQTNGLIYICGPLAAVDELSEQLLTTIPPEQLVRDWFHGQVHQ